MLQFRWSSNTIRTNQQANAMLALLRERQPKIGAFDTETDGLHIIQNKPFVYQFGFIFPETMEGFTYAVDLEQQPALARAVIKHWQRYAKSLDLYVGHNVKFDLHMVRNINLPYETENVSDTMFYIRYAHDALTPANGGPPLGLKDYAARYIDYNAKLHEAALMSERSAIAKEINLKLKFRLKDCGAPPAKYEAKSYTMGVLDEIFKDPISDYTDLPESIQEPYLTWLHEDVPLYLQPRITGRVEADMISYATLNRDNLLKYAHYDIIYTLEILWSLIPIVEARQNTYAIQLENSIIFPLWEMESVGFQADKEYLETSRQNLKQYILKRRQDLYDMSGQEFKIGQHELIKTILNDDFNVGINTTNAEELDLKISDLTQADPTNPAIKLIQTIQELRTLEKWYSTYILRFQRDLFKLDRLYTTINQVGTVSGRVTSDFQQFPKEAISTEDGVELFQPRKMIKTTGGDFNGIVYLDYSQIELRVQALYTILVGHPDLNLCRAYMPYKCHQPRLGQFDHCNNLHIAAWQGDWFLDEAPTTKWSPTDLHGTTTTMATGLLPSDPAFKAARSHIGKRTNFAKQYGASRKRIRTMFPTKSNAEIDRIDGAYYQAFPGVKEYHAYCYARADGSSFTANLFGIRYYGVTGHKLINLLVQGSCAYFLKLKIRELYDYCKYHKIKSRFQMNIHDELSWERHKDDLDVFFKFQEIMQTWEDTMVPIVAEMEATTTTWAEKKGASTPDELRLRLSS